MQHDEMEYVGFWARVGASIIDYILVLLITLPLLLGIYGTGYFADPDAPIIRGPADFVISWVFPFAAVILFWLHKQATPGKMAVSARVVDASTGNTLSGVQAVIRYVGYFVATLPLGLGIIWVAFDPRKQGWHDKLAGTVVIRPAGDRTEAVRFER
ncbi:RDD family protein [Luteimonas yindakuii]|uniref:RDD family protein n=1 Tax=Luteimonas yindakuii TaxID=2565782 RepID=UPI00110787DD|nr:RDD family protein [Luteimonas yindakuii]QCU72652.1 RDD family protein [Luteimonas yindakuii]